MDLYDAAQKSLVEKDSLQALQKFTACLNNGDCPAEALYRLSQLQETWARDTSSAMRSLLMYTEKVEQEFHLARLARYYSSREPQRAVHLWRRMLIYPKYSQEARQGLIQYYYSLGFKDSVLFHQARLVNKDSDTRPLAQTLLADMLIQGRWKEAVLLSKGKAGTDNRKMAATLDALEAWEKGNLEAAYTGALLGDWRPEFPYSLYKLRLLALYSKGKYQDMLAESAYYTKVVEADAPMLALRADAERRMGLNVQALQSFRLAWNLGLQDPPFAKEWAQFFVRRQDYPMALMVLQAEQKKDKQTYRLFTQIYTSLDSLEPALRASQRVLQDNPEREDWHNHGSIALRAGKEAEAESALLRALDTTAPQIEILDLLEKLYATKSNLTKQEWVLHKKIQLSPREPDVYWKLGKHLASHGQWSQAQSVLEKVRAFNYAPENVLPLLARCYLEMAQKENAREVLKELTVLFPEHRQGWRMLYELGALVLGARGEINALTHLLFLDSQNLPLYKKYRELVKGGGLKDSLYYVLMERYYKLAPSHSEVLVELVEWAQTQGKTDKVLKYREDWATMSGDAEAWIALARVYQDRKEKGKALDLLLEAHHKKPDESLAREIFFLYSANGDSALARSFLTDHLGRMPGSVWALFELSQLSEEKNLGASLSLVNKARTACIELLTTPETVSVFLKPHPLNIELCNSPRVGFQYIKAACRLAINKGNHSLTEVSQESLGRKGVPEPDRMQLSSPELNLVLDTSLIESILKQGSKDSSAYLRAMVGLVRGNPSEVKNLWINLSDKPGLPARSYRWLALGRVGEWEIINQEAQPSAWPQYDSLARSSISLAWIQTANWQTIESISKQYGFSESGMERLALILYHYHHKNWQQAQNALGTARNLPEEWNFDLSFIKFVIASETQEKLEVQKLWSKNQRDLQARDTAYYIMGNMYIQSSQEQLALQIWQDGLTRHPKSVILLESLLAKICKGPTQGACQTLGETWLQTGSKNLQIATDLASLYKDRNSPQEALKVLEPYAAQENAQVSQLLATLYFQLKRYGDAIAFGHKAAEKEKNNSQVYYLLAKAYEVQGQFEESQEYFYRYSRLRNQSSK